MKQTIYCDACSNIIWYGSQYSQAKMTYLFNCGATQDLLDSIISYQRRRPLTLFDLAAASEVSIILI